MDKGFLDRLLEDGQQAEQVRNLLDARFGPGSGQVDELVKSSRDSIVLRGRFNGRACIFKRFLKGPVADTVTRMQAELQVLSQHLTGDICRVNGLLAALPEDGLVVLELVPGERVSLILKSDDAPLRTQVLRLCGDWLALVAKLRHEPRKLGRHRLDRQFTDLSLVNLAPKDVDLVVRVTEATQAFGKGFEGIHAEYAIAHGDFAPVNMLSDGQSICAVDIQGGTWFPLARIVARFLVAKDLYSARSGERRWGLDADDLQDFDPSRILSPQEVSTTLPYFIGQQMVRRLVNTYPDRGAPSEARQRMRQFLTDLEAEDT